MPQFICFIWLLGLSLFNSTNGHNTEGGCLDHTEISVRGEVETFLHIRKINWFHRTLCSVDSVWFVNRPVRSAFCRWETDLSSRRWKGDYHVHVRPAEVIFILNNKSWSWVPVTIGYATESKPRRLLFKTLLPGSEKTMGTQWPSVSTFKEYTKENTYYFQDLFGCRDQLWVRIPVATDKKKNLTPAGYRWLPQSSI